MKTKWIIAVAMAALMFAPFAWSQQEGAQDQTGQQQQQGQQGQEGQPPGYQPGGQAGEVGVVQVVSWVTTPSFDSWIMRYPDMADQIAQVPYAANLFYQKDIFRQWSENYPERSQSIMEAAMEWQQMSQPEKANFFRQYPNLRGGPGGIQQQGQQQQGQGIQGQQGYQGDPQSQQETYQLPQGQQGQQQQQ